MPRPRILLTQAVHPDTQAALAELGDVIVAANTRPETLRAQATGCALVVVRAQLPDDMFSANPSLIGAVRHGAGVDMIPIDAATRAGVLVANVPGANARSVAEHVMRSLLQLARRSGPVGVALRERGARWNAARALADAGRELSGTTLGIVGYGHIGQAVARIAAGGFGMRVLAHVRSPRLPDGAVAERVQSLDALLAASDALVLACPLTPETRGLIDARRLALLKPGAWLVNVARGPVVVTAALVDALRDGRLGGAALDVYDRVPLPDDDPLWALADGGANLLLTPHMAGISDDSMRTMGAGAVAAAAALLRGEVPANCINPEAIDAFRARRAAPL